MKLSQLRRELITKAETAKAHQNKVSQTVPQLKKEGKDVSAVLAEMGQLSQDVKRLEGEASEVDQKVTSLLMTMPNKLNSSVPVGESEADNHLIKTVGTPTRFSFKAKEHWELGEKLGILDFERAGKVTGRQIHILKRGGSSP
jgi:seryl-tRNA synthetase